MKPTQVKRPITSAARLKSLVKRNGLHLTKKLGQNFLLDERVLDSIARTAELTEGDRVLEIGCGLGNLTKKLAETGAEVLACEIDHGLYAIAAQELEGLPNVRTMLCDALDGSSHLSKRLTEALAELLADGACLKVVSNLPYCISTPAITALIESPFPLDRLVLMLQKEVADRLGATPGTKQYSYLSALMQLQCDTELLKVLSPRVFWPRPAISSAVVQIVPKPKDEATSTSELKAFKKLAKAVFRSRRKTLLNSLDSSLGLTLDRDAIADRLRQAGIDPQIRGERLSPPQLLDLARTLELVEPHAADTSDAAE